LGRPREGNLGLNAWLNHLPRQLAAQSLREAVAALEQAWRKKHLILVAAGGHVIKTGLGPYLVSGMRAGWIGGVVLHGAGLIHDFELAAAGHTSEDVARQLARGMFGMARETQEFFARVCEEAQRRKTGLGEAAGRVMREQKLPYLGQSVVAQAFLYKIPLMVQVAIGADIVHMSPRLSGEALGAAALQDFRRLCAMLQQHERGIWLHLGSAVVLPEVLLKAVALARHAGKNLGGWAAIAVDRNLPYRIQQNVLARPFPRSWYLPGALEILVPLLHGLLMERGAEKLSVRVEQAAREEQQKESGL
jgi:hypothetical protein